MRNSHIQVRVSEGEKLQISLAASEAGLSVSSWVRRGALREFREEAVPAIGGRVASSLVSHLAEGKVEPSAVSELAKRSFKPDFK